MNRSEIKARAKEFAFNNKWNVWKPSLICLVIEFVLLFILGAISYFFNLDSEGVVMGVLELVFSYVTLPLTIGSTYYLIKLVKGKKVNLKKDLFSKYSIWGLILLSFLYTEVMTALWSLLFIIPGIIYSYKVIMVQFLLTEEDVEKKTVKELVNTSKYLMDGYKMDYLLFGLSFLGWILLGLVTFGIAYIWVVPYVSVANVMYYEELKKIKNV